MTRIGCGIDLVEVGRFKELNPLILKRFIQRVLTHTEQAEINGSVSGLAGKFAAKEATAKALGCGIGEVTWQEIEVLHEDEGQPRLVLHGNALKIAKGLGFSDWSLSISHSRDYSVANVIFICLSS